MPHSLVVHCKRCKNFDVYVGRKSRGAPVPTNGEWGNPFALKNPTDQERRRVIQAYEAWLMNQPELVQRAKRELRGKVLACWCAPKACHADVLARIANEEDNNNSTKMITQPATALPPIEQRVMPVFLRALQANSAAAQKLQQEGLYQALQYLQQIKIPIPGQTYSTTELLRTTQKCFPKCVTLTVPQYKQRSITTVVNHMKILDRFQGRSPRVALYGDSMLERLSRQRLLRAANSEDLFNFSVGGDGVEHLKCRMAVAHRTYFAETPTFDLLIGINNVMGAMRGVNESMSAASSPQKIAEAISHLVQLILENSRNEVPPKVYLCKLLHVLGSETLNARVINQNVDQVNALLEKVPARLPGCQLLNATMTTDPKNYNEDGLHLSNEGYRLLLAQLPEFVGKHATGRLVRG